MYGIHDDQKSLYAAAAILDKAIRQSIILLKKRKNGRVCGWLKREEKEEIDDFVASFGYL